MLITHPDADPMLTELEKDARAYVRLAREIETPETEISSELDVRGYTKTEISYLLIPAAVVLRRTTAQCLAIVDRSRTLRAESECLRNQLVQIRRRVMARSELASLLSSELAESLTKKTK